MFQPGGTLVVKVNVNVQGDIIQGTEVEINDGVSNKTKDENGQKQDGYGQEDLRACTTDPSSPGQSFQAVLEAAGGTLPEIATTIPRVSVTPCLQTALVDITRGAFAFTWAEQAT